MYQWCHLLTELFGQSGETIWLLSNDFDTDIFVKSSLILISAAEFYAHSVPIILQSLGTTGRRANKSRQIFLEAIFKGQGKCFDISTLINPYSVV